MTSFIAARTKKTLKAAVAATLCASLTATSAVLPAAAQSFRAGVPARNAPAANGVSAVPGVSVPALTGAALPAATLTGVLSAPSSVLPSVAPLAPSAAHKPAETAPESAPARPATPEKPVAPAPESDSGPRWVDPAGKPAPAPAPRPVKGPRWVKGSSRSGVLGALAKVLPFLGDRSASSEAFDGAATGRADLDAPAATAAKASAARASGLAKASSREAIVENHSIPTPEAARRVGELRKSGTPLWAKVVAPVSVAAAAAAALYFGAVPVLTLAAGLVLSVLAHEVAHLAVLHRLGDHTAEHAHSHSLNPLKHIDAVKTVIAPSLTLALSSAFLPMPFLIGAAKPVDADFNNLRGPLGGPRSARNAFWVAAAGPATNLALAGLAFGAAALLPAGGVLALVALGLAKMNLALTVFNLLPLPQLDGGKMLASVLPESLYAKWVFNPKVERGYQGFFRRLYEGPSAVLTWLGDKLGVRTQDGINRLSNALTFSALAAFYAVAYFNFSIAIPLLFLALPCSYDYWCIREKVRSEAAVQDLMDLMSQWSAVIVQIAEDHGLESEVSAYETEHAMKNALETLVDELMEKEEFRALPDDAKLEAFMKAYPDKAAEFLKDKAMTEDSIEKIKAVLADPRNQPFYEKLRKWFTDHEIFARWDNKHQQGKLKDALKEADKGKTRGAGGPGGAALSAIAAIGLGAGTGMFPEWMGPLSAAIAGLGAFAFFGVTGAAPNDSFMDKVSTDEAQARGVLVVRLHDGATDADAARAFAGLDHFRDGETWRVTVADPAAGGVAARRIARDPASSTLVVHPSVREAMELPAPEPVGTPAAARPAWTEKLKLNNGYPEARVRVIFADASSADRFFRDMRSHRSREKRGSTFVEVTLRTPAEAAELARALADERQVRSVTVSSTVHNLLLTRNRVVPAPAAETPAPAAETPAPAAQTPATPSVEDANWSSKLTGDPFSRELEVIARLAEGAAQNAVEDALRPLGDYRVVARGGRINFEFTVETIEQAADLARLLARRADIGAVEAGERALELARSSAASAPSAQQDLPLLPPAAEAPAVPAAPAEAPAPAPAPEPAKPALPESLKSHGKEDWSTGVVLVTLAEGAQWSSPAGAEAVRNGAEIELTFDTAAKAAEAAKEIATDPGVDAVKVHPNALAALKGEEAPYADAEAYSHRRALLVQFADGVTDEQIKDYAEVRRLRLVHLNFRGASGLALLEAPKGAEADFAALNRMLVGELSSPHLAVMSIRPMVEREGVEALQAPEPAAAQAAPAPEAAKPPRRDPAQAWVEFLQGVKIDGGKSNLTDKQVQLLSTFLKPIAKHPDEKRPPVVSRSEEVKRALPVITSPRGMRNSVVLIGEAGVGKTAVAEGLAEMAEDAEHARLTGESSHLDFKRLEGRWFVELDINQVLASDEPVKLLSAILDFLPRLNDGPPSAGNKVIVLMDEIQKFFLDPNGTKIANILKGPLRDGKVSVIAATTSNEYKEYIQKDDAFRRRFEKIDVEEPTVEQTTRILRAMKSWLEKLHDAVIPEAVLSDSAKLTDQFDKINFNPDKAIKAVQDAAELSRPDNLRAAISLDIRETWTELGVAFNEARQVLLDKGIASTIALPAEMWNRIAALADKAARLYAERDAVADGKGKVTTEVVKRVIAQKTGIASGQLNLAEEDASRYTEMEAEIGKRVVNQEPALQAIANAIRRNKAGLSNPNRPMGKFLLTGPTGVGKTYMAKELARFLFNDPEAMIRIDMSEYMEPHSAERFTGAPPGYVGYGQGGQLTEAVRKKPYSVILFDEIEKAHPKVFDKLLQILDDGRLTDGEGRTTDFKNTVIILSSNAGMAAVNGAKYEDLLKRLEARNAAIADAAEKAKLEAEMAEVQEAWDQEIDLQVGEALRSNFRPEFLNRLDEDPRSKNKWIRVNRLRAQDVAKIAKIQLAEFVGLLADRHDTEFLYDQSVVDFLAVEGFSHLYGARPMTSAIEKHIVDPLAKWILAEAAEGRKDARGGRITATVENGALVFRAEPKPVKQVDRVSIAGAAESLAAETFKLLETIVSEGEGETPEEAQFDAILRRSLPKAAAAEAAAEAKTERTRAFFAPGSFLAMAGAPVVTAEHNNPKKKDQALRQAFDTTRASVGPASWAEGFSAVLYEGENGRGEGALKQLARLVKEHATRAGASAPVSFSFSAGPDAVRAAFTGAYEMTPDEVRALTMHFTGTPPATYLEANQKADNLNLSARILWDHNLLDLYRRLSAIPGARLGFSTGPGATQIWLDIRREEPKAPALESAPKTAAAKEAGPTPHQGREMVKTRELLFKFVDQTRLKDGQEDGHALRIAAAEGWARLARPSDAADLREALKAKGWAGPLETTPATWEGGSPSVKSPITREWPLAMAAALVFERFGTIEDAATLEGISRRITGTSHFEVPAHQALTQALAAIYARSGLAATRAALSRASQLKAGHTADITAAAQRALGSVGLPADMDAVKSDADAYLALMERLGRLDETIRPARDTTFWGTAGDAQKQAALKRLAQVGAGDEDLNRLRNHMRVLTSYSRTAFEVSYAWAEISARERRVKGLGDAIKRYLDARGLSDYNLASSWTVLLAYVVLAGKAGGADVLGPLEELMRHSPTDITPVNEQAYFNAPDAWARALVRSGRFEEYARPQGLGPDGAPKPSKLQEMLAHQTRPMLAAAALRAIAYARDPLFKPAPVEPAADLHDIFPGPGSSSSSSSSSPGPRGPSNPRFWREPPLDWMP